MPAAAYKKPFQSLKFLALLFFLGGIFTLVVTAETSKQKQTRLQIEQLAKTIQSLQLQLEDAREDFREQQNSLKEMDLTVQAARLELRDLDQQTKAQQTQIEKLLKQQQEVLQELGLEKSQLGEQLRQAWLLGRGNQLKLILNQDNLTAGNRMLTYYRYFNKSRLTQIEAFDQQLSILEDNFQQLQVARLQLEQLQTIATEKLAVLETQRQQRKTSMTELDRQIVAKSSRLEEFKRNRRDLETLLERLQGLLADIPADLGVDKPLKELKGSLPKPLNGRIRYRFGDRRGTDMRWKGWFIEAEVGSNVQSIATGRVAYADWLRGYGLMLIVDHGDGFMSLYGNNETLFKAVGEWVEAKEVIAQSGPAVSNSYNGLYFELRQQGRATNPAHWLKK